jgi:hypothetical protein
VVEEGLHSGPLVVTAVRSINTVCVVKGWSWPIGEDGGGETAVAGEDGGGETAVAVKEMKWIVGVRRLVKDGGAKTVA